MGLNLKALKGLQEDLNNRGGGGKYLYANKISNETDIRLLPPPAEMNGVYFIEQIGYWIKGEFFLSPATFDKDCPSAEELDIAKQQNDKDLNKLLNHKDLKKKSRFLMAILSLKCEFNAEGTCTACEVVDDAPKILVAGQMLMKAINVIVTNRMFQNGTENGITDRVKGFNLILGKTGKELDTEYTAVGWNQSMEMDEKLYDAKVVPNVLQETKNNLKSDAYLRAIIRHYLYGEPKPADETGGDDEPQEEVAKPASRIPVKEEATTTAAPSRLSKKEEPAKVVGGAKKSAGAARSLVDDLTDVD